MTGAPPKVFISYSHDTVEHQERVLGLADRLRAGGIDAEIDQYNAAPPEGWPLWCERQIAAADVVLMVCTETYYRRVSGNEEPGKGLGAVWEARIIRQLLYNAGAISDKFVPVLFSDALPEQIPTPIKGWTRYVVDTEDGYEELYRRLTGQPGLLRPELGTIRPMPARRRQWPEGTMEATSSSLSGGVATVGSVVGDIVLRKMEQELKRLEEIDRAAFRRTKDSCPRGTIFDKSSFLKDENNWQREPISAQDILSDWFDVEKLRPYKKWNVVEKDWKDIFRGKFDHEELYIWKGTHDIVEVSGHSYILRMYPHIIAGRTLSKYTNFAQILFKFYNWSIDLQKYSKSQKDFDFCIDSIFLSGRCAYFESEITFKHIALTSKEKGWNETVRDYKLKRKVIIVELYDCVYTVVTGVPYEKDYNSEYIDHVDKWLSNFQIGLDKRLIPMAHYRIRRSWRDVAGGRFRRSGGRPLSCGGG